MQRICLIYCVQARDYLEKISTAQQSVHLAAFGAGKREVISLQRNLFANVPSAIIGGK
jgi:hypothetical protein